MVFSKLCKTNNAVLEWGLQ